MARYPVTVNIKKTPLPSAAKPMPKVKPVTPAASKAATQATLSRAERIQAEEARGDALLMRKKLAQPVIRTTVSERTTPAKKR